MFSEYLVWFFDEYGDGLERGGKKFVKYVALLFAVYCCVWFYQNCIEWGPTPTPTPQATAMANIAIATSAPTVTPAPLPTKQKDTPFGSVYQKPGTKYYNSSVWTNDEKKIVWLDQPQEIMEVGAPQLINQKAGDYYAITTRFGACSQGYWDPNGNIIYTTGKTGIFDKYVSDEQLYGTSNWTY